MTDSEPKEFGNVCRVFPLPGVVLLPHTVLPLHIFEPRYRQMTSDALQSDQLIAITQFGKTDSFDSETLTEPPLDDHGCLGQIIRHERLPDGRYKLLLLGRARIQLMDEIPTTKLYRVVRMSLVEDVVDSDSALLRDPLRRIFGEVIQAQGSVAPELTELLRADVPLGVLTDVFVHALNLPMSIKRRFLIQPNVSSRARQLIDLLKQIRDQSNGHPAEPPTFPPRFSVN